MGKKNQTQPKIAGNLAKKFLDSKAFQKQASAADGSVICNSIMNRGRMMRIEPAPGDKLTCPICNGSNGMVIKGGPTGATDRRWVTWSCCEYDCTQINSNKSAQRLPSRDDIGHAVSGLSLSAMGVPTEMLSADLSKLEYDEQTSDTIEDWMKKPKNFHLYGRPGVGKTFLSCCLIQWWVHKMGKTARFVTWDQLNRQWLEEFKTSSISTCSSEMSEAPLLVVDDIGSKDATEKFLSFFQNILSVRWTNRRPTIITSNRTNFDLKQSLGDAIWSRLNGAHLILTGIDYREMVWN